MAVRHLPWPVNVGTPTKLTAQMTTTMPNLKLTRFKNWVTEFGSKSMKLALSSSLLLALSFNGVEHAEAKMGVNKPELLPKEYTAVIDVAGFLSAGQMMFATKGQSEITSLLSLTMVRFPAYDRPPIPRLRWEPRSGIGEKRLADEIADLEKDTGFKLRILAQNYPDTPGLAIKDFWNVDDRTIVFVADPTFGNILNFNVGEQVDLDIPRSFWSRLAGKYGNIFYWKEKGEDASIEAAVNAIAYCLREPVGPSNCSEIR